MIEYTYIHSYSHYNMLIISSGYCLRHPIAGESYLHRTFLYIFENHLTSTHPPAMSRPLVISWFLFTDRTLDISLQHTALMIVTDGYFSNLD